MKIQFRFERRDVNGYLSTVLTHVKAMDDTGRYIAFAQHNPQLIDHLNTLVLDVPAELLAWKGKTP